MKKQSKKSDLEVLKEMFTRAGREHRDWKLKWRHVGKGDGLALVPFEGHCLSFGTEDYGPYSHFVFDADGKLVEATAVNATVDELVIL